MHSEDIVIPCDLYGRNATVFNHIITNIKGNIWIDCNDKECNAKSLLGLLSMGIKRNTKITLKTDSLEYNNILNKVRSTIYSLV